MREPRHGWIVELLILFVGALGMASFFSPALPRLHLPSARWAGLVFGALAVLLSYYALRTRRHLTGAWRWGVLLGGILLLQFLTHIPFLRHHQASLNSDRAVTLLMVENITNETSRPIYFYGQLYQGSLDAYFYSLVHRWVAPPVLSVLVGNLFFLSIFVVCSVKLVGLMGPKGRAPRPGSLFYPLLILSLPVGVMLFVSMEQVHGFALVAGLLGILMYLVFRACFEEQEGFLWMGFVAGLLFWSYQPSVTWLVVLFAWILVSLMRARRWASLAKASWQIWIGWLVGALPLILSEINNDFANARGLFLARRASGGLGTAEVEKAIAVVLRLDSPSPGREAIWYGVLFVSLCGLLLSFYRATKERDAKWIYLPVIFAVSFGLLGFSGFPPVERYLVHYRLYGLFPVLLAALAGKEIAFLNRKWVKVGAVITFSVLTTGLSVAAHRRLAEPDGQERATIAELRKARQQILLGNYWNTLRFAPFTDQIITAAPSTRFPNVVFDSAKYYPLALQLGERWDDEDRGFISRHAETRRIERLLRGLDIGFSSASLDGHVLYSGFSGGLSAELAALLVDGGDQERDIRSGSYRAAVQRLATLPSPVVEGRSIVLPALAESMSEELRPGWQYVLDATGTRLTLPLDPASSHRYTLPPSIGFDGGVYDAHLYYLGRPVHSYGEVSLTGLASGLVLTRIRDETHFATLESGGTRGGVRGLPLDGVALTVRDENIRSLDLHVYSFFDFGSSIWTNRYEQALLLDGQEIPLGYKENTIALSVDATRTFHLDTRHKTFLVATDSRGHPSFHNVGAVLQRVTIHATGRSYDIVPFLQEE